MVEYKGKTPTKAREVVGTNVTDYTFSKWDKSLRNISSSTEYHPVFESRSFTGYKVTFMDSKNPGHNYSNYYEENTCAWNPYASYWNYDTKEVTVFTGWDNDISSVKQNMMVNATYKTISREENGEYPRDMVTNETLTNALQGVSEKDNDGYYEYQGVRYAEKGGSYFMVSPTRWRCLSQRDGKTMFLSEYVLDSYVWNETKHGGRIYGNNYKESDIRKLLNNDFLDMAFKDDSLIETTPHATFVASTGDSSNPYVCEMTYDKVILLSQAEAWLPEFGFENDLDLVCKNVYGKTCRWMLRSPAYWDSFTWLSVDKYGSMDSNGCWVRPALYLRLY